MFLLSQRLFELDPNKVCQSEALALKCTFNMFLRRVGVIRWWKIHPKLRNIQAEIEVKCFLLKKSVFLIKKKRVYTQALSCDAIFVYRMGKPIWYSMHANFLLSIQATSWACTLDFLNVNSVSCTQTFLAASQPCIFCVCKFILRVDARKHLRVQNCVHVFKTKFACSKWSSARAQSAWPVWSFVSLNQSHVS